MSVRVRLPRGHAPGRELGRIRSPTEGRGDRGTYHRDREIVDGLRRAAGDEPADQLAGSRLELGLVLEDGRSGKDRSEDRPIRRVGGRIDLERQLPIAPDVRIALRSEENRSQSRAAALTSAWPAISTTPARRRTPTRSWPGSGSAPADPALTDASPSMPGW